MADLSHITIEHAPNKTTYRAGDRFERYGMAVRAHYTDGTSSLTDFYSYSPTGALSSTHTQITVELSGKTATQNITVLPAPASGYFQDKYLGGAEYGGNPCVNAADLSVRFRNDPITLASGSYAMSLTLSYCSLMSDRESDLVKGLPKGWRTDWHRFLVQDGADQSNCPIYKYIDGDGYSHTFARGLRGTSLLYDNDGRGLTLDPTARTITDLEGNSLTFDSYGRLISIASGSDPDCEKVIEYNSDGIRKIYDARDAGTYVKFSYQNSFIRYIRLYQGGEDPIKTYTLGGFPGQITSLEETVGGSTRTLYQYAVNDRDLLRRVVDCMTKDAWRITYAFDQGLNAYRMDSIRKGYMSGDTFAQHQATYFASRDQDASFGGPNVRELTVSNDDDIRMSIMTDSEGGLVSVLERGEGADESSYYPLIRDEGKWLANEGPGPDKVSNSAAKGFFGELLVSGVSVCPSDLGGAPERKISGWVMIDGRPSRARLTATCPRFSCRPVDLNPKAYRVWQYFELPITMVPDGGLQLPIDSFTLSVRDGEGCQVYAAAANLQISKDDAPRRRLFFLNNELSSGPYAFDEFTEIRLYSDLEGGYTAIGTDSSVYMTEEDLLLTMRQCHGQPWDGVAYFNGGRERIPFGFSFAGVAPSGAVVQILDRRYVDNRDIDDRKNWFFAESAAAAARTYYRFEPDYYEIVCAARIENAFSYHYECETSRYDYNGRLILREAKDGTKTRYEYFPDGRLRKSGVLAQDGESYSSVLYEATMAQDGKNVARACREGVSRDFRYDSDDLLWKTIINSVQSGQTANTDFCRELSYDAFRDDVAGAMFKDGETIREEHSYSRPSQSYKTNHFGDIASRLRISHEISTRTTSLGIHDGSGYADVMTSQDSAHSVTREYDNVHSHGGGYQSVGEVFDDYGFPTSISYGGVTMATFSYAENFASRYCSLLEEVTDLFSGRDVSIVYGDDNEVSSITVGGFAASYYEDSESLSCAEYSFGPDESYVCKADASQAFALEGSATVGPTLWSYSYDSLGRVSSKSDEAIPFGLTQTYSYSSDFPSRVSGYSLGGLLGLHYAESYSYGDAYGNLTGVSASSPSVSYGSSYQFDGLGRIVSETNNLLGISRTYQYESFGDHASGPVGRMVSFGNASMEYDEKGRLIQFGNNFYSYDHYGNRVSKNQVSYQWERGTLLSYCGLSRFEYDYRGLRSLKVDASGLTHEYFYDGERLVGEDVRDGSSTVRKLRYFYDLDGLCALRVIVGDTKSDYVCIRNPLGDIVALSEGSSIKVTYVYDAWGNHKAYDQYGVENTSPSFIGNVNPFRYRGYYFDSDTSLYYLRARYYDPEIGQFISPDDVRYMNFESIGGLNLYAYCNYNPVNYSDGSGHMAVVVALLIMGAIGATAGFAAQSISDTISGKGFDWERSGVAAAAGFLGGLCYAVPVVGGVLGSAVSSGLNTVGQMAISGEQYSVGEYVGRGLLSAAVGGFMSFAFGQLTSGIGYFADTDFFMSNFVKFATDYGGITLKNSVIAQFSAQLAVKYTVVGLAESAFDLGLGYFNNRVKGYGIQEAWRHALADW